MILLCSDDWFSQAQSHIHWAMSARYKKASISTKFSSNKQLNMLYSLVTAPYLHDLFMTSFHTYNNSTIYTLCSVWFRWQTTICDPLIVIPNRFCKSLTDHNRRCKLVLLRWYHLVWKMAGHMIVASHRTFSSQKGIYLVKSNLARQIYYTLSIEISLSLL